MFRDKMLQSSVLQSRLKLVNLRVFYNNQLPYTNVKVFIQIISLIFASYPTVMFPF